MMRTDELIASIAALRRDDLELWIGEAIVRPGEEQGEPVFGEAECARVRLICTLHYDMDVETGTLPIVLDLIDQLHETRRRLSALGSAVLLQDEEVRRVILETVAGREA
jgi:chaperone modulatory protein CbpM